MNKSAVSLACPFIISRLFLYSFTDKMDNSLTLNCEIDLVSKEYIVGVEVLTLY